MKVLFCASEVAPFAKTGGLADVAGSLPVELGEFGVQVMVVMPRYRGLPDKKKRLADHAELHFIQNEAYFNRHSLYGNAQGDYADNLERFSYYCVEALELARRAGFKPDLVHAHDWQAALLPVLLKTKFAGDAFFAETRSLLTVHNLAYQGRFPARFFSKLGLDASLFSQNGFELDGHVNLLKAGLLHADRLSTVSPTYAEEIQTPEYGCGLDPILRRRRGDLQGILNGLDARLWGPEKDARIKQRYSVEDLSGKAACKAELQRFAGLEVRADAPLFVVVSRLAGQKGFELFAEIADSFLSGNAQLAVLGEGEAVYERLARNIAARHPRRAHAHVGFSAELAHMFYAGADFFLMPSFYEPCGLGQLIAFRYGTLPVVRRTGGLADTVRDLGEDKREGNGFVFGSKRSEDLLGALRRAAAFFNEKQRIEAVRRRVMRLDHSWKRSARQYRELYRETASGKRA